MNVVQLLRDSRDTLLEYNGGHFKDAGLFTHMKALNSTTTPSVWISPHKVVSAGSAYTGGVTQRKDHYFTFHIACKMEDLDACQKALSAVYTGYKYVDDDDLDRNHPYSPIENVGGDWVDAHAQTVHWAEIYTTYRTGGC